MTLVLTTDTLPGSAGWTDASAYGTTWVQFTDPGNGGTLNPGTQSGELNATPLSDVDTRNIGAPGKLGQMLLLSVQPITPGGAVPFPTPVATFNFINPINSVGDTSFPLGSYTEFGEYALLVATFVCLNDNAPVLMWRRLI